MYVYPYMALQVEAYADTRSGAPSHRWVAR